MSKKSTAGIIIILLMGAILIGFGTYYIIRLQTQIDQLKDGDSGIASTWYTLLLNNVDVNTTYEPIDQLNTTIDVNVGEWVYCSFAGNAKLDPADILRHALIFYFAIDGALQTPGFVYEENLDDATEDDVEWVPVSFNAIFKDLDPGIYIVSVYVAVVYNACPAEVGGVNSFMGSALLIQTLIP